MKSKDSRGQAAMKKARQKRIAIAAVCVIAVVALAGVLIYEILQEDTSRVFVSAGNHITLHDDGTFVADLPHNVRIAGAFSESSANDVTVISFFSARGTEDGNITGNVLTIPETWAAGCAHGHGLEYTLRY